MLNFCMVDTAVYRTLWLPDKTVVHFRLHVIFRQNLALHRHRDFQPSHNMPFESQKSFELFRLSSRTRSFGRNHHRRGSQFSSINQAWKSSWRTTSLRKTDILLHKDIQHFLNYCLEIQTGNCREQVRDGEEDTICWCTPLFVCVKTSTCRS